MARGLIHAQHSSINSYCMHIRYTPRTTAGPPHHNTNTPLNLTSFTFSTLHHKHTLPPSLHVNTASGCAIKGHDGQSSYFVLSPFTVQCCTNASLDLAPYIPYKFNARSRRGCAAASRVPTVASAAALRGWTL